MENNQYNNPYGGQYNGQYDNQNNGSYNGQNNSAYYDQNGSQYNGTPSGPQQTPGQPEGAEEASSGTLERGTLAAAAVIALGCGLRRGVPGESGSRKVRDPERGAGGNGRSR